ncbi:Alpha/Beta hydrolase protein [Calycina marina]|uniref:Alpha/Beta hydrolase protein n=1 Tax=Calycina marina TaxID=1763456 RepID=A0A9P7YWW3_9HELO|nr:Alpha/Beta hydrolase protein [Calycina marina]
MNLPDVLAPPVVFTGLFIGLWTWKCMMLVVFQNKIIYMPGLPPNARSETIANYQKECGGIEWREDRTAAADGTHISLCVASVYSGALSQSRERVYILYFQGNASSLPPRLPFLSPIMRMLRDAKGASSVQYIMVCCSYRGYWTSKGRPTEKGIALDAEAALHWIEENIERCVEESSGKRPINVVLWGQSIGAGVATYLASKQALFSARLTLRTLILETPFVSIRDMLETLYPQKWLPYRYLHPFLRNQLNSWEALGALKARCTELDVVPPHVTIVVAGRDELVPSLQGDMLEERCLQLGLQVNKMIIPSAYHTEVLIRAGGRLAVVEAIQYSLPETTVDQ